MLEADWTDAYRANEFVHGISKDQTADQSLAGFTRFPQWMWRNTDFRDLVTSIRSYNNSGYMTEAADISKKDKVLEIGTGSGYQAAILGELA